MDNYELYKKMCSSFIHNEKFSLVDGSLSNKVYLYRREFEEDTGFPMINKFYISLTMVDVFGRKFSVWKFFDAVRYLKQLQEKYIDNGR